MTEPEGGTSGENERARLLEAGRELEIELSELEVDQLIRFLDLLAKWNRTYNLTSIRSRADMLVQHLFDCLAVVRPLRRLDRLSSDSVRARVLDVGSGGGFPGVVIAVMFPFVDVVAVDTVGKKASFLTQVALELKLVNLVAEHARVENYEAAPFDLIVSRAFSSLADFVSMTRRHLAPQACWMAMKGVTPEVEIRSLPVDVEVFHVEQIQVPDLNAERCLVWMRSK